MTRKRPLLDQCPNSPSRRRSARRRYSKSPTKLQYQHDTKTRLPPSSPLSGTSASSYGDIGYQSPVSISMPFAAPELALASANLKAKGKGREVVNATWSPPKELLNMPSAFSHGKASQESRLSSPPPSPRRVAQHPRVECKLGESSQSSRLFTTPPSKRLIERSSPLSSPPNHAHRLKEPRKRDEWTDTKTNDTMIRSKTVKSKLKRRRSPSSCLTTISDPDDDIGLSMKDTWENLFANLEQVPYVPVKEETPLNSRPVEPIRKREPTKLPSRLMDSTCLLRLSNSWFLAKLVDFQPGLTLASDRYIVQARDVIGTRAAKRSEILFLDGDEEKVKTLKGLGGLRKSKEEVPDPDQYRSTAATREATPPILADEIPFAHRSRQDQLHAIRPQLEKIIRDEYAPSLPRVDAFYRQKKVPYLIGDYKEIELSTFFPPELRRWLIRPEAGNIPHQSPRPMGSARFEQLTNAQKERFIIDVLVPESLVQLEILLNGQELLAESEETQYTKAVERLEERGEQGDIWGDREVEAQTAMGIFKMPKSQEEIERELEAQGTHYKSFAGTERLVKLVNYNEQERGGRRTKKNGGR